MPLEAVANLLEKPDYNLVRFFFTLGAVLMLGTIFWKVGTKRWFMPINIGIIFLLGGTLSWIIVKMLKTEHYLEGIVIATCSTVTDLLERPDYNLVRFFFTLGAILMLGTISWKVETKRWFMPINIGIIFLLGGTLGWIVVKILKTEHYLGGIVIATCSTVIMAVVPSGITFLGGILLDMLKQAISSCIMWLGGALLDPLNLQVQNIKDFKENVQCLLRKWEELHSQQEDVIQYKDTARLGLIKISNQNEIDHWLGNVNGLKEPVNRIEREFGENKRCLNGFLPNYYSRLKLAKEAERLTGEVKNLIEKKPAVNIVDADQVPPARLGIPAEPFKGVAAKKAFESIFNCLMNKNIAKIGVYGMGGIGKTTIIKNIKNSLQKENIFNEIVFVTVSRFPMKTIQEAIAKQIRLSVDKDYNEETMSIMLHEALQLRKRILLILDDLWEKLPLKDVGIPEPHADCKVVLTTRSYSVCQSMGTQEEIKVEVLSQDDAWSLFEENARLDDSQVKDIAKQVVKECGGLPLAIITVGQALSGENEVGVWRNALKQLKCSTADIPGMEKGVFEKLKFSFDRLRNEKLRACFLYCSLFPEDYKIKVDELINHWIWDGLIDQMDNKQDEVDNGRALLKELKRACMLEFDDGSDTMKMHDLMRDMAIGITRHKPRFMVKAGLRLEKAPAGNEWPEDVERISLMKNRIQILSGQPRCPRLRTLLLNGNYFLSKIIPHSFFDNICNLRVLDLSSTSIEMLPNSICNLEKLHVLLLNYCRQFKKMPSLSMLKELRVLHLLNTPVVEMLESLSSLENLLELNLSRCVNLKILPSFTKLKKLQNLYFSGCTSIEELPGSFSELENLLELNLDSCENLKMLPSFAKLKKLRNLDLSYCTSIKELPGSFSELENLLELKLYYCDELKMLPYFAKLKELKIIDLGCCTSIGELPESLFDLKKLCELILKYNKKLKMIPSLAKLRDLGKLDLSFTSIKELPESLSDLENLHELNLRGCKNLKRVPSLKKVEQLRILNLASTSIEQLPEGMESLVALEILELSDMVRLRRFRRGILPKLSLLQKFSTKGSLCLWSSNVAGTMEGQIDCDEIAGLTRLTDARFDCCDLTSPIYIFKILQVIEMLELRAFLKSSQPPLGKFKHKTSFLGFYSWLGYDGTKKKEIRINGLHDIICMSDFLLDFGLMELDTCYIDSCDGMQCVLAGQDNNGILPPILSNIAVFSCPKIKTLFSPQFLQGLQRLVSIEVKDCDTMEELITGDDDKTGGRIVLPKLQKLKLINLPALERISSKLLICNSLHEIKIKQCPLLKKVPLCIKGPKSPQSVSSIEVAKCIAMEELMVGDDDETGEGIVHQNLQYLILSNLPALERIITKPLVGNSLKRFKIEQCPRLKKIPLCIDTLPRSFYGEFVGKKEWWDVLDWHNPTNTKLLLQPFFNDGQEKEASAEETEKRRRRKRET